MNPNPIRFILMAWLVTSPSGFANVITVTNAAASGEGSLFQAIEVANDHDIINFDASLDGATITLAGAHLLVPGSLEIDASTLPNGITIDANHQSRVLRLTGNAQQLVILRGLTLTGGRTPDGGAAAERDGACIYNGDGASLTIEDCTLTGNETGAGGPFNEAGGYGGAIYNNGGVLTLIRCSISGNGTGEGGSTSGPGYSGGYGGGLYCNGGTVRLTDCAVDLNRTGNGGMGINGGGGGVAGRGGGIYFNGSGSLTLERCSVSENNTGRGGDPGGAGGSGGGIFNSGGTLVLTNVTVAGNLAGDGAPTAASAGGNGGGIFHNLGSLALIHCTVADNHTGQSLGGTPSRGGGIFKNSSGTLTIRNTIIGDNTAPGSGDDVAGTGTFAATGRNFVEDDDIASTGVVNPGDPALGVLADNGGPTRTIRLLTGSTAIDWAPPSDPPIDSDQRGVARAFGDPDVGAYEADGGSIVVNTLTDENDGLETNGISLRDALTEGVPHSRITFDPVVFGGTNPTIVLSHGELSMIGPFIIDASDLPGGLTIDAEGRSRVLRNRHSGSGASLLGVVLTGGNIASWGGGIQNDDLLTLTRCTVSGNSSLTYGGGIGNVGTLVLNVCTLSGNSSSGQGGGILVGNLATLTLTRCTVSGNSASGGGGGIVASNGTIHLSDSIIAGNHSTSGDPNLYVDSDSSINMQGNNLLSGDPRLAPLGTYGGATLTMPPLPGSSAIDGCLYSDHNPDQRGFPRPIDGDGSGDARADIGAVEYNAHLDLPGFWGLDWDGDGSSFGTEYALGTDPLVSDPGNPRNPRVSFGDGSVGLGFGIDSSARTFCQWVVLRSTDLSPGSWLEIYRRYGPTGVETLAPGFSSAYDNPDQPASVVLTEETPSSPAAFYRLTAEFVPDGPS